MRKETKTGVKKAAKKQPGIVYFFHQLVILRSYQSISFQCALLILNIISIVAINGMKATASDGKVFNSDSYLDLDHSQSVIVQTPDALPPESAPPAEPERIYIRQIKVIGSTVFNENELNAVVQQFTDKELTQEDIRKAADAVTQLYLNKNYLNSRAVPVTQQPNTTDGIAVIQVIEGRLADIEITGTKRLNPAYIRNRIQLGAGIPLNAIKLEEQLRLLRIDPLFDNVEASLRPSGQVGQSLLLVRVQEAKSFEFGLSADNYSPPSVGSERLGIQLRERNLTGIGDELAGSYYRSVTGGADSFDFSYQIPVNAMNGKVQLRVAPSRSEITEPPFKDLGIRAEQDVYEINYRQPLVRTPREEFALSLGFTYQDGQTFLFDQLPTPFGIGPDENGVSRTSVIKFAQDYTRRDQQGAWSVRSQFNFGTGLFDATTNNSPTPDGHFFSWLGQLERVQRINDNNLLIVQADLQITPDSLLPSQQFVIGGGQSVRGYRQNARSGDNGFRVAIEDRITVKRDAAGLPIIQVIPFTNLGAVWNKSDNPNNLPNQTFLASAGLGLLWNQALGIEHLIMRLDYGIPFIDLDDRGNNAQDDGFYFSVRYQP
ncbi:ShlB/FhaC/HecB family hemolysin secretion/activation protein [Anabaena cylindrica FACHB-243]|uniref:Surface antigen (D15) n=1 Tax=Anabaena cylindrica (strain ATCC 27899 / PCC 7122) TaxID=272123 RepID=K9ZMC4_ANACC|nr:MULTISPECIES: ShlB/FhaC/HecB family hemolysin secretion/activation protein [Anabaena]AFZ59682.1 surface antigen (D15) [Anabaena cylindrica PCC 7122]MBD2418656.1 ShlB/FhaC/HecB family hemolysin secretion/activation protein [Anabaena cylindrica FACHB-243]MBY5283399.1 ShlB/FhaC/HecB family hemolysin secretion/activation protein [Anabaena sp. CCAP 1446/1C]MBY5307746.1 ShlB/FhaC/HecB family hemolysin secretion/activation protein [Anabaena sp. CCAP 1446/1C]MCM2406218.1 ShlB/FhaC/HecB family hemol